MMIIAKAKNVIKKQTLEDLLFYCRNVLKIVC